MRRPHLERSIPRPVEMTITWSRGWIWNRRLVGGGLPPTPATGARRSTSRRRRSRAGIKDVRAGRISRMTLTGPAGCSRPGSRTPVVSRLIDRARSRRLRAPQRDVDGALGVTRRHDARPTAHRQRRGQVGQALPPSIVAAARRRSRRRGRLASTAIAGRQSSGRDGVEPSAASATVVAAEVRADAFPRLPRLVDQDELEPDNTVADRARR
jgi:hypothetical protein